MHISYWPSLQITMAGYWPNSFLYLFGLWCSQGPWQISTWQSNIHSCWMNKCSQYRILVNNILREIPYKFCLINSNYWKEKPRNSVIFPLQADETATLQQILEGGINAAQMVDLYRQLYIDIVFFSPFPGDKSTLCYTSKNHKWTLFPPPVAHTGSEGCQERPPPVCIWHETGICPKTKNTKWILTSFHSYRVVNSQHDLFFFFFFFFIIF